MKSSILIPTDLLRVHKGQNGICHHWLVKCFLLVSTLHTKMYVYIPLQMDSVDDEDIHHVGRHDVLAPVG